MAHRRRYHLIHVECLQVLCWFQEINNDMDGTNMIDFTMNNTSQYQFLLSHDKSDSLFDRSVCSLDRRNWDCAVGRLCSTGRGRVQTIARSLACLTIDSHPEQWVLSCSSSWDFVCGSMNQAASVSFWWLSSSQPKLTTCAIFHT